MTGGGEPDPGISVTNSNRLNYGTFLTFFQISLFAEAYLQKKDGRTFLFSFKI